MNLEINPRTAWRNYDGTVMVITCDDSKVHTLNETASFLWCRFDGKKRNKEELLNMLLENFEIDKNTGNRDLCLFIEEMLSKGILTEAA